LAAAAILFTQQSTAAAAVCAPQQRHSIIQLKQYNQYAACACGTARSLQISALSSSDMQLAPAGQHLAISDMQLYLQDSKLQKAIIRRLHQPASATSMSDDSGRTTTTARIQLLQPFG
jgi:hypothetical protein